MTWFIIGALVGVAGLVAIICGMFFKRKDEDYQIHRRVARISGFVAIVLAIVIMISSCIVTIQPGFSGRAYSLSGKVKTLKVGRNGVSPFSLVREVEVRTQTLKFAEVDDNDPSDIYGAQTKDGDYLRIASTLGARPDPNRLDQYLEMYGVENLSSKRIYEQLKAISRDAAERVIGLETTSYVMSSKTILSTQIKDIFSEAIKDMPIIIDSFTIDDLQASDEYERAIKEQAQLRMNQKNQLLTQEVNAETAKANKIEAEGIAEVRRIQAENDALVKKIEAENTAEVKKIQAENAAEVKKIEADNEAEVKRIQAEADASVIITKANADAEAVVKAGEAEAKALKAQGEAYTTNPELMKLKLAQIEAELKAKWAEKWSGFSFEGLNGITFTNFTDLLKGIIPQVSMAE